MANLTKRIIDLQTTSTLGSDDYVMVDGATNGTKKYLLKDILDEIEDIKEGTALETGAVTTDKLAAGAVTNAKIDDGAVDTTNIADDAVTAAKIADGAVGTDALAANAVTGAKIATGAVGTGNIASGAVTLDKIASDSNATSSRNGLMSSADKAKLDGFSAASNYALKSDIVGAYIFKGSVNTENDLPSTDLTVGDVYNIIAASSYGESGANVAWTGSAWDALGESFDISDGAIDTEQLADGAVTNGKLADGAKTTVSPMINMYTDSTYGSGTRQGYEATFGNSYTTVTLPKVGSDLLIDVENIPTIPEKKIGYGAVTANKIAAGAVDTEKLANSAVNTDKLATAAVSTDKIASLAVTTNKIAAGAVDNSKLANNAVGTAQIANGAVTSEKLGSDVTTTINSKAAASDVTALSSRVDAKADQEYVDEELEYKADIDGYYSQLTAGLAENLIGRGDAVPAEYLYRTAGGTADIEDGIATIDCIKGNVVTWNQLINVASSGVQGNGSTISKNGNTVTALALDDANAYFGIRLFGGSVLTVGHKYLFATYVDASSLVASAESTKYRNVAFGQGGFSGNVVSGNASTVNSGYIKFIYEAQQIAVMTGYVNATAPTGVGAKLAGQTFSISNPQFFDLTLMFGAGNEPSTVAEFEAMFPLPYYPYSAPKLLPVDMRGIETVGFNLWDEEWESGGYTSGTGTKTSHANQIRNSNPIRVLPNTEYYVRMGNETYTGSLVVFFYDAGMNYLSNTTSGIRNGVFTTPAGCRYINIQMGNNASPCTTYNHDICINLSWSGYRNGEYEEHWSAERPIDTSRFFPTGLKKVGDKADALYSDHYDTVIGAVDLGTLTWNEYSAGTPAVNYPNVRYARLLSSATGFKSATLEQAANVNAVIQNETATLMAYQQTSGSQQYQRIYISSTDLAGKTASQVQEYVAGIVIYYVTDTPTTTEIDPPLNLSYKVSDFGTERIMVDETADSPQSAPVPMEVEYGLNAIDTIRRLPTNYVPRKELEPKLDEKADVDGYYAAMTVGAADNLTGRGDGVSGQYLYRTAGGDEDIADGIANIRSIKGQTLVWNQKIQPTFTVAVNTSFATKSVDGDIIKATVTRDNSASSSFTFNGVNINSAVDKHKLLLVSDVKVTSSATNVRMKFGYSLQGISTEVLIATGQWTRFLGLLDVDIKDGASTGTLWYYNAGKDLAVDDTVEIKNWQLFDLTLMFGAGNEPATAAEFEALFPKVYYPYSEPTLFFVNMEGIETVGFNQWDEEWEVGSIGSAGNVTDATKIRSKNYIPVFPGQTYYVKSSSTLAFYGYDANKTIVRAVFNGYDTVGRSNATLTIPSGVHYLRFYMTGTTYNGDICINLSWSGYRNGEYEEHWNSQREIPVETYFPDGMRSAGSVADELTPSKAVTRVGVVDLGTLTWFGGPTDTSGTYRMVTTGLVEAIRIPAGSSVPADIEIIGYSNTGNGKTYARVDKSIGVLSTGQLVIYDEQYNQQNSGADFKTAMSGVMLYYALAEPTEVTIEPPLNLSYKVSDFGTEKVMVDEEADAPQSAPPIIQTAYGINATDTVRRLPTQYISHESFQQFVAALQSAVGITVTETWDENDGRYEYTVTQTGE